MVYTTSGSLGEAYRYAKANNRLFDFFTRCFVRHAYCYNIRTQNFHNFSEEFVHNRDFHLDLELGATIPRQLGEHYRVFRNLQVQKFCNEGGIFGRRPDYQAFKATIDRGEVDDANTQAFYRGYCTRDRFEAYLQEKGHPVREGGEPVNWETVLTDEFWG